MFVQIKEFPSYLIDENGTVVSTKFGKWKVRVLSAHPDGYLHVRLTKNKHSYLRLVHRLVATTFLGDSQLFVNHKDFNRKNNRLENLEYVTNLENIRHAVDAGRFVGRKTAAKLTELEREEIKQTAYKENVFKVAERFGVKKSLIYQVWSETRGDEIPVQKEDYPVPQ